MFIKDGSGINQLRLLIYLKTVQSRINEMTLPSSSFHLLHKTSWKGPKAKHLKLKHFIISVLQGLHIGSIPMKSTIIIYSSFVTGSSFSIVFSLTLSLFSSELSVDSTFSSIFSVEDFTSVFVSSNFICTFSSFFICGCVIFTGCFKIFN